MSSALDPLGMEVEVVAGDGDDARRGPRAAATSPCSATRCGPPRWPGIAGCVADYGGNIDRIVRIARYPVTAVELEVSGVDPVELRARLAVAASTLGVDVAVERSGLQRRAKRLVVMDVDSTLVQGEVIEMLAEHAGCADRGRRGHRGGHARRAGLRRVAARAGAAARRPRRERAGRRTPRAGARRGARTFVRTLKRLDYKLAIVSGGFTQMTDALVADLGIDYSAANTLEVVDGRLTGELVGPVVDRAGKAAALERFAAQAGVPVAQTVAIGDGANDLDMLARAGLGIAFNAKPVVREAADAALTVPYLDAILFLLGISREEIEAADAEEGITVDTPPT